MSDISCITMQIQFTVHEDYSDRNHQSKTDATPANLSRNFIARHSCSATVHDAHCNFVAQTRTDQSAFSNKVHRTEHCSIRDKSFATV